MKFKLQIFFSAFTASILATSVLAQDSLSSKTDGPGSAGVGTRNLPQADRLKSAAKASDVLGMTVMGSRNEKIGRVEELALDVESGRIVQVILATSGFLNIGDTLRAVPPRVLRYDAADKIIYFGADKETLKSTPTFAMSDWAEDSDYNHLAAVYRQYNQELSFNFVQNAGPGQDSKTNADGAEDQKGRPDENQSGIPVSRLSHLQKAGELLGFPVKNLQDQNLGKVEDILLDLPSGRVVAVVVSSGGFLGIADELSAIPPAALRFSADRANLQLDASKGTLSNAPHFNAGQWPDFAQPSYVAGIYRAYRVEPY